MYSIYWFFVFDQIKHVNVVIYKKSRRSNWRTNICLHSLNSVHTRKFIHHVKFMNISIHCMEASLNNWWIQMLSWLITIVSNPNSIRSTEAESYEYVFRGASLAGLLCQQIFVIIVHYFINSVDISIKCKMADHFKVANVIYIQNCPLITAIFVFQYEWIFLDAEWKWTWMQTPCCVRFWNGCQGFRMLIKLG